MRILSMSGMVPEQICDTIRFTQYHGERNISHYCGYASDFISESIEDKTIDGVVFPKSCDSSRIIKSYLGDTEKFCYQINVPARQDRAAVEFFANVIRSYKLAIEKHYLIDINDIEYRIKKINERNSKLKELYDNLDVIKYSDYLKIVHDMLKLPLNQQNVSGVINQNYISDLTKRVYVVGSFLSNLEIVNMIENVGLKIVGDNIPESGRLVLKPEVSLNGEDIYINISKSMIIDNLSPTQNNFREILNSNLYEIKSKQVNGVLFIIQKNCEPYEYLYSVYKKIMDENGIPVLKITLNDTEDTSKVKLLLETFADII